MSWKRQSVSMPTTHAGILGITSDTQLGGVEMEPKTIVLGIVAFIVIVKVVGFVLQI